MRTHRALLTGVRRLTFEEIEVEETPPPGALRARTEFSAVSTGTEVAAYLGDPPLRPGPIYPRKVGYCNVAVVERVGLGARAYAPGDLILTTQPHQGAFVCDEHEVLAKVPVLVEPATAALAYLAQLGLSALQAASFRRGERVTVLGLGVIGLATVALAATLGARVAAIGNDPARLELARRMGAAECALSTEAATALSPAAAPEIIVTTANPWAAWQLALELARFRTRISVLGFPGRSEGAPPFNPLASEHFYQKQLALFAAGMVDEPLGGRERLRANLQVIFGLLAEGRLPLGELISHRVPWQQLENIYAAAAQRDKSLVAAVLEWRAAA